MLGFPPLEEPPLYHLLLHGWIAVAGAAEVRVRLWSVLCGTASLACWWLVLSRWLPRPAALWALALAAASPFQIIWTQQARPYALRELLTLGGLAALLAAEPPRPGGRWRRGRLAVALGCATLAPLAHLPALAWTAAVATWWWVARGGGWPAGRRAALTALGTMLPAALVIRAGAAEIAAANAAAPVVPPLDYLTGFLQTGGAGPWVPGALAGVAPVLFVLAAGLGLVRAGRSAGAGAWALAIPGTVLLAAVWMTHAVGLEYSPKARYACEAQLVLLALAGAGVVRTRGPAGWGAPAALLVVEALSLPGWYANRPPALDLPPVRAPFREAAAWLRDRVRPDDLVVSVEYPGAVPLHYYLGAGPRQRYVEREGYFTAREDAVLGPPAAWPAALAGGRRAWVVVVPVIRGSSTAIPPDGRAALGAWGRRAEVAEWPGLRIERWDR